MPVLLPDVENWMPTGTGVSPLAAIESFVHTTCPICGQPARRETDVSDNFLDSAWYFLRYFSHDDETQPWDPALVRKWLPVDMYIGGAEHSVLHLMYVRFLTMALHDLGHLDDVTVVDYIPAPPKLGGRYRQAIRTALIVLIVCLGIAAFGLIAQFAHHIVH